MKSVRSEQMSLHDPNQMKLDRKTFSVSTSLDDMEVKRYWHSLTPNERIQQIETLRHINYGHLASERLQRVFEIAQCP